MLLGKLASALVISCLIRGYTPTNDTLDGSTYNSTFFVEKIFEKYGSHNVITYEGFEHLLENLGLGRLEFEKGHDVSLHKVNGSFLEIHDEKDLHRHWHAENETHRSKRHALSSTKVVEPSDEVMASHQFCLSPQQILLSYGIIPDHGIAISKDNFRIICPAIVYELDQKHCWEGNLHEHSQKRTSQEVWLEATLAILLMSVCGLLCAAVVPLLNKCDGGGFLQFLVAIATGTLAGDAIIHLLPHVLVPNSPLEDRHLPLLRGTVTLFSIVFFFIIECALTAFYKQSAAPSNKTNALEEQQMVGHHHSHVPNHRKDSPLACVVIAGDILHNVTDGLSIGAAFNMSRGAGLACATAVFCHELPHELGDYAVLLKEGMGIRRALLCNLFSSVFSFFGMCAGIILGEIMNATKWINAFTAGSFIYIALANLIPELKHNTSVNGFLLQLLGLSSGIALMFFIGFYEDDWEAFMTNN